MATVKWREGFRAQKADAQRCAEEIASIGPAFTTDDVCRIAMDKSSELHKCFCWDDQEILKRYRTIQAREIVRALVVEETSVPSDRPEVQAFVVLNQKKTDGPYVSAHTMSRDESAYKRLLSQASKELKSFRRKYCRLREFDNIFELMG